jgi:ATP-dependent DNA ligase
MGVVPLPFAFPLLPMLATRVGSLPPAGEWLFEPKWDGFRTLVFRDGDEVLLQSRDTKSLNRYFPELLAPLLAALPPRCVLDGEIVISRGGALDFDALQLRIHPAASRVRLLAEQTPASIVFFDLLATGDEDLRALPFRERRRRLEETLAQVEAPLHLTPVTGDRDEAADWFRRFEGAGFDGVVAKGVESTYEPDKRTMLKIKHERDCDCVVAGLRWYKDAEEQAVGSLLLGLFNAAGTLQHVGVCASFSRAKREELTALLAPYRESAGTSHPWLEAGSPMGQRVPGEPSRWNRGKDLSWVPLRPELVVEVAYEHMQGDRFRHMAQFRRWRPDRAPETCTYAQLEVVPPQEIAEIFGERGA